MSDDARLIWSTRQLADHVGVTTMQIGRYVEAGMPKLGRGKFDAHVCCRWIQEFRRKADEAKKARIPGVPDFWDEKARLTALQAEKAHDLLLQSRGELIRIDELLPALD